MLLLCHAIHNDVEVNNIQAGRKYIQINTELHGRCRVGLNLVGYANICIATIQLVIVNKSTSNKMESGTCFRNYTNEIQDITILFPI
jgi:hypothetical protein